MEEGYSPGLKRKNSVPDNTTDTGETLSGNGNDTATPENTAIYVEKPVSASSSDIETEPKGKRNGTATPQNGLSSDGKGSALSGDKQGVEERSPDAPEGNPADAGEAPKAKKRNKWISDEDAAEFDNLCDGLRSHLGADESIVKGDEAEYGDKKV